MNHTICPVCKRCPFSNGVCEDRANRSRRYFLMGALVLPVAAKIERVVRPRVVEPMTIQIGDGLPEILRYSEATARFRIIAIGDSICLGKAYALAT